jgi:hypothetical protein
MRNEQKEREARRNDWTLRQYENGRLQDCNGAWYQAHDSDTTPRELANKLREFIRLFG